ncbi:murein L,D-transpeptidase [Nocardioides sp. JQ2195]|uniref:L,D-transpeptidase family protein n=1 Tax=Nocardioides sp. JQ2195 TaxID=2592334 RepID=UPI00143EE429|nr:L,D-transpeptidase family protein [Nocardioides sp. JQ2195]QIX26594.1 murein L,D-transpeptidase [Nocardioides sp. JQ2195]
MKFLAPFFTLAVVLGLVALVPSPATASTQPSSARATNASRVVAGTGTARLQKQLNSLGCNAGPVDGVAGSWTKSAVIRFQSRHGLAQTGTAGRVTKRRLYADSARRCDSRPVPARSGAGRRIVISQAQNWVWLVDARGRTVAQGGMVDNPGELSRGSYATGSYCGRAARVRLNRSGSVWLDNFIRFAPCGFGFHQVPRSMATGNQIHPNWFLGTNFAQSHGCIRLSRAMSLRLWDFTASARTTVRVV